MSSDGRKVIVVPLDLLEVGFRQGIVEFGQVLGSFKVGKGGVEGVHRFRLIGGSTENLADKYRNAVH